MASGAMQGCHPRSHDSERDGEAGLGPKQSTWIGLVMLWKVQLCLFIHRMGLYWLKHNDQRPVQTNVTSGMSAAGTPVMN